MSIVIFDDDGEDLEIDEADADVLWRLTDGLDAATVSACPDCRSRVLASVALTDLVEAAPALACSSDLVALADDAPTLHLYLEDSSAACRHRRWRDPGAQEWRDARADLRPAPRAAG